MLKVKEKGKKIHHAKIHRKKTGVTIIISDQVDFKTKNIIRNFKKGDIS